MVDSSMRWFLVVSLLFLVSCTTAAWTSLRVKYGSNGFFHMPTSLSELENSYSGDYYLVDFDDDLNCSIYSFYDDPRVMILFDLYGNIAGLRTCYIKSDVGKRGASKHLPFPYRYDDIPMFSSHNYWGVDAWCATVLFLSPDKLKAGGRQATSGVVDWSEVWVNPTGTYINISKDESQVTKQLFTKQNCFKGMGMHYFFNMTTSLDCDSWPPVFLLYEGGQLIGLGLTPIGSFTSADRVWFEVASQLFVKAIVPARNRPKCVLDYTNNYGLTALHIFFKKHPQSTFCL